MTSTTGTVLVPLDGSKFAEQALSLATTIARATRRRIRLCHVRLMPLWPDEVVGPDTIEAMTRILHSEGESYLRQVERRIAAPDLPVEATILPGDIVSAGESLALHLAERPADLVVMASHGFGGIRRAWLGSVADYLVRHLSIPVALVRPDMEPSTGNGRILVPLDGSALGEQALAQARELALALKREIVLLRVVPPVSYPISKMDMPYIGYDVNLTASLRELAEEYLDGIKQRLIADGIACSSITMLGPGTAETIVDTARPEHFSMIIISSHGRGGVKRVMLGSVADKVARAADIPVMILHPRPVPAEPHAAVGAGTAAQGGVA